MKTPNGLKVLLSVNQPYQLYVPGKIGEKRAGAIFELISKKKYFKEYSELKSELLNICGIGPKTVQYLFEKFQKFD